MPKVGVSNEPLLERALFAYDGEFWRPVLIDSSGNLVAAVLADQNVQARLYGWDGSAWQKAPPPFGWSGVASEGVLNASLAAGYNALSTTAVPAGEVHVYTVMAIQYTGTVPTNIRLYPSGGIATPVLLDQASPVSERYYIFTGTIYIPAGSKMTADVFGATAGDDLRLDVLGYKMEIA